VKRVPFVWIALITFTTHTACDGDADVKDTRTFQVPAIDTLDCGTNRCVYYHVGGNLYPRQQPTKYSCWATTLAMLTSWREKKNLSIEEVLAPYDAKYRALFAQSDKTGIGVRDEISLYEQANLEILQQLNPSIDGWEFNLREYGPLFVTIDARPPYGGTIHAILITGIYGRIDGHQTRISYIDPLDGLEREIDFMSFMRMYEAKYSVDWQIQIVHCKKQGDG
jgi:hypothetical protein